MKIPDHMPDNGAGDSALGAPDDLKATFGGHHMSRETIQVRDSVDGSVKEMSFRVLEKSIYGKILKDDGYFSSIDPLKRIRVAENTYDLGQYLLGLHRSGELATQLGPVPGQRVYYPPCHQREQGIGTPYLDLLALIPDMSLEAIQTNAYCCGIAGIMGFKRDFHKASLYLGSRLMAKIKKMDPDHLVTDCLSCRLQFNQMTKYPVIHPIEILSQSYGNYP
jgi:glycerol-3-phosphate dehydrogenase subunit C